VGASRDVAALARRSGLGVEAAGRRARQELLEELRRERGADRIATAHHLDDHLETLFLWLGRGSALSGLVGIEASTDLYLRPLRSLRRRQLRDYLESRGLSWREDATNQDRARLRNHVRAELLPVFESIFGPGAAGRLDAFSRLASEERAALREAMRHLLESCRHDRDSTGRGALVLDRERVLGLPAGLRLQLLRQIVCAPGRPPRSQRWNTTHLRRVLRYMEEGRIGSDLPLPEGGRLSLDRETLTFWPPDAEPQEAPREAGDWVLHQDLLPAGAGQVTFLQERRGSGIHSGDPSGLRSGPKSPGLDAARATLGFEASFDAERVQGPLLLRRLRQGDRIAPAGMQGHRKKIRRLLAERAVPRHQRDGQLVVEDRHRVIWAVGLATCHSARIQESTRSVLRLRVEPEPGAAP
jgi:tRNA(Ile)-lysidine synthase